MWFEQIDSICGKGRRLPRSVVLPAALGLVVGVIISSAFWRSPAKLCSIDRTNIAEEDQLIDQIRILQQERDAALSPSPTPSPLPYVEKEALTGVGTYGLSCFDVEERRPAFPWLETLSSKLDEGEELLYFCLNDTLKRVALISQESVGRGGGGSPDLIAFRVQLFYIPEGKIELLEESRGNYLGGWCNRIIAWTRTGNIYYRCGGAGGPWSGYGLYRINVQTRAKGIIETCDSFANRKSCSNYCRTSAACKEGHFCDLETSSCVQSCTTDSDCVTGSCRPYGPTLGCRAT